MARLKEKYQSEIMPALKETFSTSPSWRFKLEKIVINMGLGEAKENAKVIDGAINDLSTITGQRPVVTKAKISCCVQAKRRHEHRLQGHFALVSVCTSS